LEKVTEAIGAGACGVAVGPALAVAEEPEEAEGALEPAVELAELVPDGVALPTAEVSNGDGAGDSPDVASRAPAAMIRITHASPRMADRLRQLVSFTEFSPQDPRTPGHKIPPAGV
jgi:hypothetical protein